MNSSDPPQQAERRPSPRRRSLLSGLVVHSSGRFSFPCTIRDLSVSGARIVFAEGSVLPSNFELVNRSAGIVYRCETVWTKGGIAGVKFLSTFHMVDLPVELDFLRRFR